jgi:hypothetical protein
MKIHQIPLGTRFEYEGEEYAKTGPQLAIGKHGQRLIPKYAVLKPLGETASAPAAAGRSESLPHAQVLAAFERYHARCSALVPDTQRVELEAARMEFLKAMN